MAKKFEISTVLRFIDRATRPIQRIGRRIGAFSRGASRSIRRMNKSFKDLGQVVSGPVQKGLQAATVAATALALATGKVIQTGADFEQKLVSAAVKFPGEIRKGTKAFEQLEYAARKTGATTEFTAAQSAQALEYLAFAGFDAQQAMSALPGVVDLATASGIELARASDIATDSLGALGLATKDTAQLQENLTRVSDVLSKTTTSANTNMEDMFDALVKVGPAATKAGGQVELVSALIGELANAGIKGQESGTALRNMFLRLQAPVGAAKGLVQKYIGEIEGADGKMISMIEVIRRMEKSMARLSDVEKTKVFDRIFGKRAIGPALVLMQAGSDSLSQFEEMLKKAGGASENMATAMRDTTTGSLAALKSAVESVVIDLFKLEDSGIKGVIDRITEWIRVNKDLITSKIGKFLDMIIDNADTIWKVIKNVGAAAASIWLLVKAFGALQAIMSVVAIVKANPYVLIAVAIAAAAGLIIANWDSVSAFFQEFWAILKSHFMAAWNFIKDGPLSAMMKVVGVIVDHWDPIVAFFAKVFKGIASVMWKVVKFLFKSGPIGWLVRGVKFIINNWKDLPNAFRKLWKKVGDVFVKANDFIGGILGFFVDDLVNAINMVKEFFGIVKKQPEGLKLVVDNTQTVAGTTGTRMPEAITPVTPNVEVSAQKVSLFEELGTRPQMVSPQVEELGTRPQMVSPQERTARYFEQSEQMSTQRAEVVIKDETGRAEMTNEDEAKGFFKLEKTGTFDE